MWISVMGSSASRRLCNFPQASAWVMVYAPVSPSLRRANEQNMQLATQTLVALMCRLRLKYVRSPCSRSRTSLASAATIDQVGVLVQGHAVVEGQRLSGAHLVADAVEGERRRPGHGVTFVENVAWPIFRRGPGRRRAAGCLLPCGSWPGCGRCHPGAGPAPKTMGPNSSSAPKPKLICARRGPSAATSVSKCGTDGRPRRHKATKRRVSRPCGSPSGRGQDAPQPAVARGDGRSARRCARVGKHRPRPRDKAGARATARRRPGRPCAPRRSARPPAA